MNHHSFEPNQNECQVENWTFDKKMCIMTALFEDRFRKVTKMGLMQSIANSRAAFMGVFTAAAFTAGTALAQDNQVAAVPTVDLPGKHVTLRVGPGFSTSAADGVADYLEKEVRCPVTVTSKRGFPGHLTVDIEGYKPSKFKKGEIGSAALVAKRLCLGA
jgi:hypothetical protein